MLGRSRKTRSRAVSLLVVAAMLLFAAHTVLPHRHSDMSSERNCQVRQLGHSPVQQPIVQANTEPPTASEANPPSEDAFRELDPVFLAELTRAPPA